MANEITNQDIMDMLTVLVERTNRINDLEKKMDSRFDKIETEMNDHFREIDVKLEAKIEPTLQAILENQTEVINNKRNISVIEGKQEELKDRVDVIEYAVKQNQQDIEELKKRA